MTICLLVQPARPGTDYDRDGETTTRRSIKIVLTLSTRAHNTHAVYARSIGHVFITLSFENSGRTAARSFRPLRVSSLLRNDSAVRPCVS